MMKDGKRIAVAVAMLGMFGMASSVSAEEAKTTMPERWSMGMQLAQMAEERAKDVEDRAEAAEEEAEDQAEAAEEAEEDRADVAEEQADDQAEAAEQRAEAIDDADARQGSLSSGAGINSDDEQETSRGGRTDDWRGYGN